LDEATEKELRETEMAKTPKDRDHSKEREAPRPDRKPTHDGAWDQIRKESGKTEVTDWMKPPKPEKKPGE
jgi:hypothetical protein